MQIGGLQKISLIDYPKKIATTIFVQGCPFRCHYCHNSELVLPSLFKSPLKEEEVLKFLKNKIGKIDGVVISGGEPTSQKDLISFIKKIKEMGFLIKLDTSGINPGVLKELLQLNLLDYIAMDLKAPLEKYSEVVGTCVDIKKIEESITLIMTSNIDYEFRSTILEDLHSIEDIKKMAKQIENAPLFVLQKFIPTHALNPLYKSKKTFSDDLFIKFKIEAEKYVKSCQVR